MIAATPGFRAIGEAPQEGLAAAKRRPPDLVLLDVRMPRMDGIRNRAPALGREAAHRHLLVTAGALVDPLAAGTCGAAAIVRKQDLAPRTLRSPWEVHASSGLGSG